MNNLKKGVDFVGVTTTFVCHDGEGHILMNKRSINCRDEHGNWDPGGGSVDWGVGVEVTLKKEIAEEYTTDVLDFKFLGYRDVHRVHEGQKTHWISLDFLVLVDRSKVSNGEPHKFDDLAWFTLDALPQPLHSQWGSLAEQYREELEKL